MREKMMIGLIALVFVFSSIFLMASCAKKQVQVSEGLKQEEAEKGKEAAKAGARDAARQAELQELEKAKKFANEIRAFEGADIYFDFDKSDLEPEAKANLQQKADWLRSNPLHSVIISGNCDERGTAEYNLALGERRAYAAKKYLVALGISGDRISTISYGEESPADPGHNEEAWAKNRRDAFTLSK